MLFILAYINRFELLRAGGACCAVDKCCWPPATWTSPSPGIPYCPALLQPVIWIWSDPDLFGSVDPIPNPGPGPEV